MSNNGIPPLNDWQPDNYPIIYDEGDETLKYVKSGEKNPINIGGSSYLVYTASIGQISGTLAMVTTDFENTLGETVTASRVSEGRYRLTASGSVFTANKTVIVGFGNFLADGYPVMPVYNDVPQAIVGYYSLYPDSTSICELKCFDTAIAPIELHELIGSNLGNGRIFIEIRVYP